MADNTVRLTVKPLGLQGREYDYSLATWKEKNMEWKSEGLDAGKALLCGAVRCLWVSSPEPGTGKTGYAVSIMQEWARQGRETPQIVRMPQLSTGTFEERKTALFELPKRGLLILDDLHRMRWNEQFICDWFFNFSDALYLRKVYVIVTANASYEKLRELACGYSKDYAASFDRFRDGGHLDIEAKGKSARI